MTQTRASPSHLQKSFLVDLLRQDFVARGFNEVYFDWPGRREISELSYDWFRGVSSVGLTDKNQQRIQGVASGYSLRYRGTAGRNDLNPWRN